MTENLPKEKTKPLESTQEQSNSQKIQIVQQNERKSSSNFVDYKNEIERDESEDIDVDLGNLSEMKEELSKLEMDDIKERKERGEENKTPSITPSHS